MLREETARMPQQRERGEKKKSSLGEEREKKPIFASALFMLGFG